MGKKDPDCYILPFPLMRFLWKLHEYTAPQPVDFGRGQCNNNFTCYTQGGLYGWNQIGFESTFNYMSKYKGTIYNETLENFFNPGRNILESEDVFTSYVFRKATKYPVVFNHAIGISLLETLEHFPKDIVSLHPIKTSDDFYRLEKIFYLGKKKGLKSMKEAKEAFKANIKSLESVVF